MRLLPPLALVAVFLALALPSPGAQPAFPLLVEEALTLARNYLSQSQENKGREILGVQFIPAHGTSAKQGYWLVDLMPYGSSEAPRANPITSLLIDMEGKVRERGGRRTVTAEESEALRQRAAKLSSTVGKEAEKSTETKTEETAAQ